ncbi:aminotransferase class V-fold PLP-dependent enzyme [Flavobacterium cerinum]|uniref:Aminotransferase class V-fold PLP-dependent enzyme n=1 Tax=Flavobacterium cerinum TaxID=2502784 RepID=A0ABY5IM38_9FLAO|nr:aminotransferase class V-fold PLP-dependent enzyme [Flavobacterium cerinum]UUC43913.1 aminotransferase class V-fold PLP-dependent enzyme [Flavobacterium cerinum]
MKLNLDQIRQDTPNCLDKLYFNNAGASLMPKPVVAKIQEYLIEEEKYGGYAAFDRNSDAIQQFYNETAQMIDAAPHNIAFAHSATDAYAKALSAIDFREGDVLLTTADDYVTNHMQFLSLQKRFGIVIKKVQTQSNGDIDFEDFERIIKEKKPKLIAVTHIPTNSGLVQDVEKVSEICTRENIIFLLDACQSVGQLPVSVAKIKCDFMSVTGRKFLRGPRGTGFLYISDAMLEQGSHPLFIDGAGAIWRSENSFELIEKAKRFQYWELPYALVLGLKEAILYQKNIGIENIQHYNDEVMAYLRQNIASIPGVATFDRGSVTSNILTFTKENKPILDLKAALLKKDVYCSISARESGLIDFDKKGIPGVVRISPHYYNTIAEVDQLLNHINEL